MKPKKHEAVVSFERFCTSGNLMVMCQVFDVLIMAKPNAIKATFHSFCGGHTNAGH